MIKNLKGWDWFFIVLTAVIILFHNQVIEKVKELVITQGGAQSRSFFGNLWRKAVSLALDAVPGGNIIRTVGGWIFGGGWLN